MNNIKSTKFVFKLLNFFLILFISCNNFFMENKYFENNNSDLNKWFIAEFGLNANYFSGILIDSIIIHNLEVLKQNNINMFRCFEITLNYYNDLYSNYFLKAVAKKKLNFILQTILDSGNFNEIVINFLYNKIIQYKKKSLSKKNYLEFFMNEKYPNIKFYFNCKNMRYKFIA